MDQKKKKKGEGGGRKTCHKLKVCIYFVFDIEGYLNDPRTCRIETVSYVKKPTIDKELLNFSKSPNQNVVTSFLFI